MQYVLPPNSTAYIGCVGKDGLADQLRAANDKEGLYTPYQVIEGAQTGACAVVITGHHRSLCTELGAAEKFDKSHLETAEVKKIIDGAKFFYLEGYFLTHGLESAMILAKHSKEAGKVRDCWEQVTYHSAQADQPLYADIRHELVRSFHCSVLQEPSR